MPWPFSLSRVRVGSVLILGTLVFVAVAFPARASPTSRRPAGLRLWNLRPIGGLLQLAFEFQSLLELGRVHKVLWPPGGQLRGEEVSQVEEVCRGAADIEGPTVLPTGLRTADRVCFLVCRFGSEPAR